MHLSDSFLDPVLFFRRPPEIEILESMRNRQSKAKQNCEAVSSIHLKVSLFTFCYYKCLALYISTWYLLWQDKKSDQERWSLSRHFDAEIARAFAWNFYGIFQIPGGRLRSWIDFHERNKLFGSQLFSLNFHWKVLGILKLLRMYRIVSPRDRMYESEESQKRQEVRPPEVER